MQQTVRHRKKAVALVASLTLTVGLTAALQRPAVAATDAVGVDFAHQRFGALTYPDGFIALT